MCNHRMMKRRLYQGVERRQISSYVMQKPLPGADIKTSSTSPNVKVATIVYVLWKKYVLVCTVICQEEEKKHMRCDMRWGFMKSIHYVAVSRKACSLAGLNVGGGTVHVLLTRNTHLLQICPWSQNWLVIIVFIRNGIERMLSQQCFYRKSLELWLNFTRRVASTWLWRLNGQLCPTPFRQKPCNLL